MPRPLQSDLSIIREVKAGRDEPTEKPISLPWLLASKAGDDQEVRLAILFLLLLEHAARAARPWWRLSESAEQVLDGIERMRQIDGISAVDAKRILERAEREWEVEDELAEALGELNVALESANLPLRDDPIANLSDQPGKSLSEYDVVRLLDPFPAEWDVHLTLGHTAKIGKGLVRLNLDVKKLLNGDGSDLHAAERLAAHRYARELLPQREDWPLWLGGSC